MLAERYGWTIEHIGKLNVVQIEMMFEGIKRRNKISSKGSNFSKKDKVAGGKYDIDNPLQLFNMPGVNMTPAMKNKLAAMKNKKKMN